MATTKAQRWGILVIVVVLTVGTLGSFAVLGIDMKNQSADAARQQKLKAEYDDKVAEYQEKVNAQAGELSSVYYDTFKPYESRVATFDRDGVTEMKVEDLVVGSGAEIGDDSSFYAYYIGWNPKGKVFDQSIDGDKLKAPLPVEPTLKEASLIEGWKEGMKGMKIGGIREITIPSDKAYGEQGQGDDIPPNTPIKFVVMAIESPEQIAQPEFTPELMQMMIQQQRGQY